MSDVIQVRACGAVETGAAIVKCECGLYRQASRRHGYIPEPFEVSVRFVSPEASTEPTKGER
jgi:hypothetical protein